MPDVADVETRGWISITGLAILLAILPCDRKWDIVLDLSRLAPCDAVAWQGIVVHAKSSHNKNPARRNPKLAFMRTSAPEISIE